MRNILSIVMLMILIVICLILANNTIDIIQKMKLGGIALGMFIGVIALTLEKHYMTIRNDNIKREQ